MAERNREKLRRRIAELEEQLAVYREAVEQPCPLTRQPFFALERESDDAPWVPTYGGPYYSLTTPSLDLEEALNELGDDREAKQTPRPRWRSLSVLKFDQDTRRCEYEDAGLVIVEDELWSDVQDHCAELRQALLPFAPCEHLEQGEEVGRCPHCEVRRVLRKEVPG